MQSSEGVTGAGGPMTKMVRPTSWSGAGCQEEASVLCYVDLSHGCLSLVTGQQCGSWFTPESVIQEATQKL